MLTKDFIKGPLLKEIEQMTLRVGEIHAYLGFCLIASSIEFFGACLDPYEWGMKGMSEKRFRLAINTLFDQKYKKYNKGNKFDLYSNLRCSLSHTIRPGNSLELFENKHRKNHLSEKNGKLILVYENFVYDFKIAGNELIKLIDNKSINNTKVYNHIIETLHDDEG